MAEIDLGIEGIEGATEIGRGGFGVVYRAVETELDRTVAIKVLAGEFDERARLRFDRERRAMGSLSGHANIVTVYRSGFTAHQRPYLLMEYLADGSIADRLRRQGRLPWTEVTKLGIDIGRALATAHRAGVLHRDVKPGNILLGAHGTAKLGDFGIARLHGAPETKSAVITASVAHAPPEVLGGARPDERADIYSLASTLFELAWGAPAFVGADDESLMPMLSRIVMEPPPDLRAVGVPSPVADVISTAMAKNADQRFPTADAFADALEQARTEAIAPDTSGETPRPHGAATTTSVTGPSPDPASWGATPNSGPGAPPTIGTGTHTPRTGPLDRRSSSFLIGLGAVVFVVVAVAAVVTLMRPDAEPVSFAPLQSSIAPGDEASDEPAPGGDDDTNGSGSSQSGATPTTPAPPSTTPTTSAPASTTPPNTAAPVGDTRRVVSDNGAISLLVPADWTEQTSDTNSLLVTPDLEAALADEWVKGALLQVVRNTPEQNPGGFAPDVTLDLLIAESECVLRERGPYADVAFIGSYAVLDQCGGSGLSTYFLVASPPDLSIVVLVAVSFVSPQEDPIVQLILDSLFWTVDPLP